MSEEELYQEELASQVVIVEHGQSVLFDPGGWLAPEIEVRVLLEISHW